MRGGLLNQEHIKAFGLTVHDFQFILSSHHLLDTLSYELED